MARGDAAWFSFKGIESTDMGVWVARLPDIPLAEARGKAVEIPGRDGALWQDDGAFRDIALRVDIEVDWDAELDEITAWLTGAGDLTLSTLEDYRYEARVVKGFDLKRGVYARGWYRATVEFSCKPFRYQLGRPLMTPITQPGSFRGRGTWFARPVITVYGSGDVNLLLNGDAVLLDGVDGHITLDCEAMMAFRDGVNVSPQVTILSDDDAWPRLNPGDNQINWTGSVSRVVIQPNWRWR